MSTSARTLSFLLPASLLALTASCSGARAQDQPRQRTGSAAPSAAPPTASGPRAPLYYRSPMNPSDTSPVPRSDAMGMQFVPVYADDVAAAASSVPGEAAVRIDPERRRLVGLRTAPVRRVEPTGAVRTVGRIVIDEKRVARVQPRFEGYIEKLAADYTGKRVARGERLASIYSPELLAAEEELLLAVRGRAALAATGLPDAAEGSRARLRLLGVSNSQLDEIVKTGRTVRSFDVLAPIAGVITVKNAVLGARVAMDQPLFEIVDLSTVWLLADCYEADLPRLALGQAATATVAYWPGRTWRGRVSYIAPTVDDKTRTVKVRIEVDNARGELRPEMFADVVLLGAPRSVLAVPEDAIIDTGTRKVVFVDRGEGKLEPREVGVGLHDEAASGSLVEVRTGLVEGESVAVGASFLLDSESRLKAAVQSLTAPPRPRP